MKQLFLFIAVLSLVACQPQPEEGPDHAERAAKYYEAFAEGDIDFLMAGFTDDIQWYEAENYIYGDNKPYVGGEAIMNGLLAKIGTDWEYWNLVDKTFENVGDNKVLVTGRYNGKNKATGKVLDAQFAHVLTMRDTLVMKFQQYTDTKQAWEVVTKDEAEEAAMDETSN